MELNKILIVTLLFSIFCCDKQETEPKILKIVLKSCGLSSTSITQLDCDYIDQHYHKKITIEDENEIEKFKNIITKLKINPTNEEIDARVIIYFFYENKHVDTICLGTINQKLNGKSIYFNAELFYLVNKYE
ncbi:MAG: hypothetical protein SFY32_01755 [Bacteroidota bacterium]|nr:hypothetical protein [Bacteroidota bacterium]